MMRDQNNRQNDKSTEGNKQLILELEKNVAIGVWIKVIGQVIEVINLSKIMTLSEELSSDVNERQVLTGVWIQTLGQFMEGIGVTKQVLTSNEFLDLEGQKITVTGDWLQALGIVLEANAGSKLVTEEQEELMVKRPFLP
ncbi:MAG: hypothetical protein K0S25_1836 [Bacillus sp. (in: firmicutes)]|jgi:hypothetical protein|nr:hypothetical protein [Bacillus sp. (in: firmicutes)]